jgi:hypothetical protein
MSHSRAPIRPIVAYTRAPAPLFLPVVPFFAALTPAPAPTYCVPIRASPSTYCAYRACQSLTIR